MRKVLGLLFILAIALQFNAVAEDNGGVTKVVLQQGVSPKDSYEGCRDTYMNSTKPTVGAGNSESIELNNQLG